jgi:uncharacterized protein YlzI (FlbEa/FlbD family)
VDRGLFKSHFTRPLFFLPIKENKMKIKIDGIYIDPERVESLSTIRTPLTRTEITMQSGKTHIVKGSVEEIHEKHIKSGQYCG